MTNPSPRHGMSIRVLAMLVLPAVTWAAALTARAGDSPAVPPPRAAGNQWSIALLPDPQGYNQTYDLGGWKGRGYQYKDRFPKQIEWIVSNIQTYNVRFAVELGDSVQDYGFDPAKAATQPAGRDAKVRGEWLNAQAGIDLFHKDGDSQRAAVVPYAVVIGNHDYHTNSQGDLASQEYELFFGPGRWKTAEGKVKPAFADWFVGDDRGWRYEAGGQLKATGSGRNSCQVFTAAGRTFLHLTLECGATDQAIAWARSMLADHPGKPTIISIHGFIDGGGKILAAERMGRQVKGPNPTNDGQQIFDKLIKDNDQIFLVFCGHMWSQKRVDLSNAKGNSVHVLEQCYHLDKAGGRIDTDEDPGDWIYKGPNDRDRNGSGWMTLLVFDPDRKTITRYTYSPVLGAWATSKPADYDGRSFPKGDVIDRFEFDFDARFGPASPTSKPAEAR
ncbi:MAG: hypothetical protein ACE15C_20540 [Phycisphaerae bacterium]